MRNESDGDTVSNLQYYLNVEIELAQADENLCANKTDDDNFAGARLSHPNGAITKIDLW